MILAVLAAVGSRGESVETRCQTGFGEGAWGWASAFLWCCWISLAALWRSISFFGTLVDRYLCLSRGCVVRNDDCEYVHVF
jgi:hypothetical protein